MLIRSLASNYLKRTLRSPFGRWILGGSLLAVLCFWAPVFLYAFYTGFSAVGYLDIDRSVDLLAGVNPAILPVLIAWGLFDGLLLRRKVYVSLFSYLITPTPRRTLALFRQIVTLFGKFNLFVLAFIAGFWVKNLYLQNVDFAWNWLLVLCLLCICMHLAANILRSWRGEKFLPVLGVLLCVSVLAVLEWGHDVRVLSRASATLFDAASSGAVWPSILLAGLAGCLFYGSVKRISRSLYIDHSAAPRLPWNRRRAPRRRSRPRTLTAELLSCEWKLILRNRQPRSMMTASVILTLFIVVLVVGVSTEVGAKNIPGVFILWSLWHPIFYFTSAFDFRSAYYNGLSVWPISETTTLRTMLFMFHRIILSIIFIFALATIIMNIILDSRIFFGWIFMQGSILFAMGILNYMALFLNVLFPIPRTLNAGMTEPNTSFVLPVMNAQSIMINAGFIIFLIMPVLVEIMPSVSGVWSGLALGALGLAGLCLQPWLMRLLARRLQTRRYLVMERFRIR